MISQDTLRRLNHSTGDLLSIAFDPALKLSSYGHIAVLGDGWLPGDFEVSGLQEGEHGIESIQITLGDPDFSLAWRVREEWRPGIDCEWHLLYFGSTGWETDLLFSGQLEKPRIGNRGTVDFEARVASADTAWVPRVPFESSHSLARGAEVVLNGTTYRIE